jgi:CHAT domain-containing protein
MYVHKILLCMVLWFFPFHFFNVYATDDSQITNVETVRLNALRQVSTANPKMFANQPKYEVVSLMSSYYLLLFEGKHREAHRQFAKAFKLNPNISDSYIKERNYFHFWLADSIDMQRDSVIDELNAAEIIKRKSMSDYWDHQWERLEKKYTQEWLITRVMEALSPPMPGKTLPFGKQVENFISAHNDLISVLPIDEATEAGTLFGLGDKLNLLMLLERGFLKTHQEMLKGVSSIDPKPYKSVSDALLAIYPNLTSSAKLTVSLINDYHAEDALMREYYSSADALYAINMLLMNSLEDDYNGRNYFLTKAALQRGHISILQGQLAATQRFLSQGYKNAEKIANHEQRAEMLGFYHRYQSQFQLHSGQLENSNEELKKSNEYFVSINNHNAIGGFAELSRNLDLEGTSGEAIKMADEGLEYLKQFESQIEPTRLYDAKARLILAKAQALLSLKEWAKLKNEIEKGLALTNRSHIRSLLLAYQGDMNHAKGRLDEALDNYIAAKDYLPPDEQSDNTMIVNLRIGKLYHEKDLPLDAQPFLKRALAIHTAIRKSARASAAYEAKLLHSSVADIEGLLIGNTYELLRQSKDNKDEYSKQLLYYSELIKSRSIIDEMESMRRGTLTYMRPGALDEMPPEALKDLSKIFSLESTIITKHLKHENIFEEYNKLASDLFTSHKLPVVVVEYVPVPSFDKLLVYVFDDKNVAWLEVDEKWSSIQKDVTTYRKLITESLEKYTELSTSFTPDKRTINRLDKIEKKLQKINIKLGNSLFPCSLRGWNKPLNEILKGRRLVIVPHGILHNLPFAALSINDGDHKRSIIDVVSQISFSPSYKTLRLVIDLYSPNIEKKVSKVLLVGDEEKTGLSNVNAEFDAIRSAFNKDLSVTFSTKDIKTKIKENPAVHFAVHGKLNHNRPFQSGLSLGDNVLKLYDIMMLELFRTRVVTMASCESSAAEITKVGDDVWSLATGFLFAGVPAVIGAQWNQDGKAAAHFYKKFYREISIGETVGKAYKDAMLEVREEKYPIEVSGLLGYKNPAFWAGFHLVGE